MLPPTCLEFIYATTIMESKDFLAIATYQPVSGCWRSKTDPAPAMIHSRLVRNETFTRTHPFKKKNAASNRPSSANHACSPQLLSLAHNKEKSAAWNICKHNLI
ncbi:uncharacterized protein ACOB7L_000368 [Callospermophilus lateralis]|uniref:uncharacterized protein LOC143382048 n=1 Tax=Callospermophilus lateralis TaxID=76772 RepID=UPI004038AD37